MNRYVRSFASPDEVIELETVRSAMISRGGWTVSFDVHQPGWRWSLHHRPLVRTEWCEIHHVGVLLRGRLGFLLEDGTEVEAEPLSLIDIPPGHDAWVAGEDAAEVITWTGARGWLAPLEVLRERVLATLLFTDIVDSTGTARRMGDRAWSDHLATVESRNGDIVTRFRGRVVKTTGDGMLAIFDGAARALRCALVLGEAAVDLGLELRVVVHTGEVEVAGDDVRGMAVHEASRMLSLANSGDILVSATTAGLTTDRGFDLEDRGEHELRGIEGRRRIFAFR
jgi:class 3 adenylate cyclase